MYKFNFRILIIHNIAWSHYKAVVFSKLYELVKKENLDLKVLQIAINEKGRKNLGDIDLSIHQYPYKVLFNTSYEETSLLKRTKKIINEIKTYNPDVIVVPGYFDWAYWIVVFYSKLKDKKIITGFDSTEFDHERVWIKEQIKKYFLKLCDGGFCYGVKSKEYISKLGMIRENAFVRYQATDSETIEKIYLEKIRFRDELKITYKINKIYNFIYVGRLSPEKNIKMLINTFCEVKKNENSKDWGLIIVGDGPQKEELLKLVNNLELENDVFFIGAKSWKEVVDFYTISDVFILPSISEPWGLVVNEAMICGLPVIVSKRCGSYWDLVKEGINGFGFDPFNQKELEGIMLKFINNEVDMKKMGEESRNIIKDYTPENAAKQMLIGIKRVLGVE